MQQQRAADLELLLLATRQGRRLVVDAGPDPRKAMQHFFHAGSELAARQRDPAELFVVPHRQRPEEIAPLRHERNAVGEKLARRLAVDTLALESEFARTWNEHAEQRLQHRRFAGAVWTDQQRDLGAAGIERGPAQDREARRVASHDVVELDDLVGHETGALNFPQFPSVSFSFRDTHRAPAGSPARPAADLRPAPCLRPCRRHADTDS